MKINLEFNNTKELEDFVSLFKTKESPGKTIPIKVKEEIPIEETASTIEPKQPLWPFGPICSPEGVLRERKLSSRGLKFRQQIQKAIRYSKKHKIELGKSIKKLYKRYANNWDYEIAERLGYKDPRKKEPTKYDETKIRDPFITKRTRILTDMGWDHDEAEKNAREAWELGERDPDNFSKTKTRRQET